MTLFSNQSSNADVQHKKDSPDTWVVEKFMRGSRVFWLLKTSLGKEIFTFSTKKEAVAAKTEGRIFDQWHADLAWFEGKTEVRGETWLKVKGNREKREEDQAKRDAAEYHASVRKVEKLGTTQNVFDGWKATVEDPAAPAGKMEDVATEMFDLLKEGQLIDPDRLDRTEAAALYRELAEVWGFGGSVVSHRLHRMRYHGLDADMSAIELLEDMEREERDLEDEERLLNS